ncbi:MAG TPA: hypothetical protein EYN46_01195 [Candidatus Poseidoniales archaeon]|nr:hypothetical protein [Candidatus Poseidoniales archaeon]
MGEAPETGHSPPLDWPGRLWLDGRTPVQVGDYAGQAEAGRGPMSKAEIPVFHNPAMTGSRTRSVLLLDQCLREDWLTKPGAKIRVLDGLAASAIRSRRWLSEIPTEYAERLRVTAIDADATALAWARANHQSHPPGLSDEVDAEFPMHERGLRILQGDLRARVLEAGWQWVDLDPFGPPTPFLDTVLQGLARVAVVDVTATDTAALCGAAADSARRRYGTMAVVDDLRHDTAMRVLLGHVASVAARHDRAIEPLMAIFDDHHVRVSIIARKSKQEASSFAENIGWRIHNPSNDEVAIGVARGLHPAGESDEPQLSVLIPWDTAPGGSFTGRISGPLWTGPLGKPEVYAEMTAERAVELCALDDKRDGDLVKRLEIPDSTIRDSQRLAAKAVRGLAEVAEVIDLPCTYPVDMVASLYSDITGPPSPTTLAEKLREKGWRAAKDFIAVPAVRTNAPWDVVIATVREIAPTK